MAMQIPFIPRHILILSRYWEFADMYQRRLMADL